MISRNVTKLIDIYLALGTHYPGIFICITGVIGCIAAFILILKDAKEKDALQIFLAVLALIAMLFCAIPLKKTVDEFSLFKPEEQKEREREEKELRANATPFDQRMPIHVPKPQQQSYSAML